MAKEHIDGQMIGCILAHLITTKCTVKENLPGLMDDLMKVNTTKIRNKAKVFIHGQMGDDMMEIG